MKIFVFSSFLAIPVLVNAHGEMVEPPRRPITPQYKSICGALNGAGDTELLYAPVELLSARTQADRPAGPTFNMMNGCRGLIYELENPVTELQPDIPFNVEWVVQAPHPGKMVLSIVKPKTDSIGKITYEAVAKLLTIDPFSVTSSDPTSTKATIPKRVMGCGKPGDCALQFYWHSTIANQTYPTCADIVIVGSGQSSPQNTTSTPTTAAKTPPTTGAETPPTTTPETTSPPAADTPGNAKTPPPTTTPETPSPPAADTPGDYAPAKPPTTTPTTTTPPTTTPETSSPQPPTGNAKVTPANTKTPSPPAAETNDGNAALPHKKCKRRLEKVLE